MKNNKMRKINNLRNKKERKKKEISEPNKHTLCALPNKLNF